MDTLVTDIPRVRTQKVNDDFYNVVGEDRIYVSRYEYYRNSQKGRGHGFKGMVVEYTAILRPLVETKNPDLYEIAKGATLAALKVRLGLYLHDEAAGKLGERHRYGFGGDRRPVGRLVKEGV